jgi:hypothetical protein
MRQEQQGVRELRRDGALRGTGAMGIRAMPSLSKGSLGVLPTPPAMSQ